MGLHGYGHRLFGILRVGKIHVPTQLGGSIGGIARHHAAHPNVGAERAITCLHQRAHLCKEWTVIVGWVYRALIQSDEAVTENKGDWSSPRQETWFVDAGLQK